MISFIEQKAKSIALDLEVETLGMVVTVKAGTFVMRGVEYSLEGDQEFTASENPGDLFIDAKLCLDDGTVVMIVDEIEPDGRSYDWKGSPYEVLWPMFYMNVPENTTSLDDVDVQVYRVTEPEEMEDGDGDQG